MSIQSKLLEIQKELKVPKGQWNDYGKYHFRSCEDILEAVKPLAHERNCIVLLTDDIVVAGDWHYVKSIAMLKDCETGEVVSNAAYAREIEKKSGMDESQLTGTASTYARKYALNGLFAIDDVKDADTNEHRKQTNAGKGQQNKNGQNKGGNRSDGKPNKLSDAQINRLMKIANKSDKVQKDNVEGFVRALVKQRLNKDDLKDMTRAEYDKICNWLEGKE